MLFSKQGKRKPGLSKLATCKEINNEVLTFYSADKASLKMEKVNSEEPKIGKFFKFV